MVYTKEVSESFGVEARVVEARKTDSFGIFVWTYILGVIYDDVPGVITVYQTEKIIEEGG